MSKPGRAVRAAIRALDQESSSWMPKRHRLFVECAACKQRLAFARGEQPPHRCPYCNGRVFPLDEPR